MSAAEDTIHARGSGISPAVAWYARFASLILLFFLTQSTRFETSVSFEVRTTQHPGIAVFRLVADGIEFNLKGDTAEYHGIEWQVRRSIGADASLRSLHLSGPGIDRRVASGKGVYLFGQHLAEVPWKIEFPELSLNFGDWSHDGVLSEPLKFYSGQLNAPFVLEAHFVGRGEKAIHLLSDQPLTIRIRDGYIDNDISVCTPINCLLAENARESPGRNVSRILNFFLELLFAAALVELLLTAFSLFQRGSRRVAQSALISTRSQRLPALLIASLITHAFFTIYMNYIVLGGIPHVPDSATYLRQAILISHGMLSAPLPAAPWEAFQVTASSLENGMLSLVHGSHFWPGLLAVFLLLGLGPMVNPLFSTFSVYFLYRAAKITSSQREAVLCAGIYACSPFMILMGVDFMMHAVTRALLLGALWAALSYTEQNRANFKLLILGGALALCFAIRPLTTALFALPLLLFVLIRCPIELTRSGWKRLLIGALPWGVLLILDYRLITGEWFKTVYGGVHGISFSPDNLSTGLNFVDANLAHLPAVTWGWPLSWVVLVAAVYGAIYCGGRFTFLCAMIFVSFIAGHSMVNVHGLHGYGPRFFSECFFAVAVLAGRGMSDVFEAKIHLGRLGSAIQAALAVTCGLFVCIQFWKVVPSYRDYNGLSNTGFENFQKAKKQIAENARAAGLQEPSGFIAIVKPGSWQATEIFASIFDPSFSKFASLMELKGNRHLAALSAFRGFELLSLQGERVERCTLSVSMHSSGQDLRCSYYSDSG